MSKFGIGQPVPRTEDPKFLTGQGRYTDDVHIAGEAYGFVVRSPHAHADIKSIDVEAARAAEGVVAVLTGAEYAAEGLGPLPVKVMPVPMLAKPPAMSVMTVLQTDRVRYVGDPVAFVVAESSEAAKDAAELVEIDYATLPAVASLADARGSDTILWDGAEENEAFDIRMGDMEAVEAALSKCAHVTTLKIVQNRVSANPIEPRAAVAEHRAFEGKTTLYVSAQMPHFVREVMANEILNIPETQLRVVSGDVGGGFGMKGGVYPEDVLVTWAARKLGRPVRWAAERGESFLSDTHGRDQICEMTLGLDADGKAQALKAVSDFNVGAYLSQVAPIPALSFAQLAPGVYAIPAVAVTSRGLYTTTPPLGPYRGAGRPEAAYAVDRVFDRAAREMGIDPVEMRRANFVRADQMPYDTGLGLVYDSGDFAAVLDTCIEHGDVAGFAARKASSEAAGKLRGLGYSYFLETATVFNDRVDLRFDAGGNVTILSGLHSHGQGHATVFAQMVHEWLGVPFDKIRHVQGDTDQVSYGRGTFGSRSATIGSAALRVASDQIIERGKELAAHMMEAAADDMTFDAAEGSFAVAGTDKKIDIGAVAAFSHHMLAVPPHLGVGMEAVGIYAPTGPNFPNGCHICEVEIDPETGKVDIVRYSGVDDVGLAINPLLLEGQIHGGIAQGIGQALMEEIVFGAEDGQQLSASFLDYCMPRADDMPYFKIEEHNVPCTTNPLGVKGVGEGGTTGAPAAVMHAVLDALAPLGVEHMDMPATPARVMAAIRGAGAQ
ncbi:MAG: xanthine dehydrogenase family protein molybdopterin-binding subunit [Alphaproteobacteria bacterium]|nr:xanthine dehydrogenase family protein molybdopterin-binding subunit [Alphaproteobacteria bacterium]